MHALQVKRITTDFVRAPVSAANAFDSVFLKQLEHHCVQVGPLTVRKRKVAYATPDQQFHLASGGQHLVDNPPGVDGLAHVEMGTGVRPDLDPSRGICSQGINRVCWQWLVAIGIVAETLLIDRVMRGHKVGRWDAMVDQVRNRELTVLRIAVIKRNGHGRAIIVTAPNSPLALSQIDHIKIRL